MSDTHPDLGAVFDAHVRHEFEDKSVEATMMTMTRDPYVFNVPTAIGGFGYEGVVGFYRNHFVGKMPADTTVERISRTVGEDQVVDELILKFTHNVPLDSMLPEWRPLDGMWSCRTLSSCDSRGARSPTSTSTGSGLVACAGGAGGPPDPAGRGGGGRALAREPLGAPERPPGEGRGEPLGSGSCSWAGIESTSSWLTLFRHRG